MQRSQRRLRAATVLVSFALARAAFAQYDAPSTYYSSITTQTGASLKSALETVMSTGHTQTSYDQARDFLPFTDANPNDLTQMFEFYTHVTIQKTSATQTGFVGIYNSREHVWPDSLQGAGNTSGGTKGSRGDISMLKPLSNTVNGARGNDPYGGANQTGTTGAITGGYWFPGTTDKGDAARIIFYAGTRWGSTLTVVNGQPATNTQMGDLASLLRFHYQDVPDLFELRRNDVIYRGDDVRTTGDDLPTWAGTGNRNAFIDRPEYVWSVYADQQNDTQLSFGTPDANGGSTLNVDLGRVLRNAPAPGTRSVTLNKAGVDGTYYSVTPTGSATSSVSGRYNAFTMDSTGSRAITVGLNTTTTTAGLKSGSVVVDNLDVTTQGGAGRGANDANDTVNVSYSVLDASNPSFSASQDLNSLTLDWGDVTLGSGVTSKSFSIANLASSLGLSLTAALDLDSFSASGSTGAFSTNLAAFKNLAAGASSAFNATLTPSTLGTFSTTYTLSLSDEDLPGTQATSSLTLNLVGRVIASGEFAWSGDRSGNYDTTSNWSPVGTPDGTTARARFGPVITQRRTVTLDATRTLAAVTFDSPLGYDVSGAGTLALNAGAGGTATLTVVSGAHTVAKLSAGSAVSVDVATGSSITAASFTATGQSISKTGAGTFTASTFNSDSLTVSAGTVATTGLSASRVRTLSIAAGATLDLRSAGLIVDYDAGTASPNVRSLILGGKLVSSTTPDGAWSIGFVDTASLPLGSFLGQTVDASAVVARLALNGDTDLNGAVNFDDLLRLAARYGQSVTAWSSGDFNYDGVVNFDDLLLLAANYGRSDAPPAAALALVAVPEPTTAIAAASLAVAALRRRRR